MKWILMYSEFMEISDSTHLSVYTNFWIFKDDFALMKRNKNATSLNPMDSPSRI